MSISCKICSKEFQEFIHWTHLKLHGLNSAEYKKQYGAISSPGRTIPAERKEKISQGVSKFGKENPNIMRLRTQKAINTKLNNGYDFGSPMRGKTQTEKSKDKSRETIALLNKKRTDQSNGNISTFLKDANLTLNNDISEWVFSLTCNSCSTAFTFTKQYFQPAKFTQSICPTCYPRSKPVSGKEQALYDFVSSICPSAIQSYREKYHSKEIDIFVPELNLGIEFNGLYWHSEEVLLSNNRSPKADFDKLQWASSKGIRLIQIFEDEWDVNPELVKSRLSDLLHAHNCLRVFARNCSAKKITGHEAAVFCQQNHIMGKGRSNACYGLFDQGKLVSVMTFTTSNLSRKGTSWELNRFCSLANVKVVGGASKLFTAFIREYDPDSVISYSDNRWSEGKVYAVLGFEKVHSGISNFWYTKANLAKRIHRFTLRKRPHEPIDQAAHVLRKQEGYSRIWDSGSAKWQWSKNKTA